MIGKKEKKVNKMTLTREEQKSVLRMVMESHQGITLSEAKTNGDIREEMKLNLEFYNSLKEDFLNEEKTNLEEAEGLVMTVLGALGSIKDYLTGLKVIKDITAWIQGLLQKLFEKLSPQIDKFIPQKVQDLAKDGASAVTKFIKWLYNTLSYKGLAKLFARIRYRKWRTKPTDEQIKCMELAAKKVYKWVVIALIAFFVIKLIIIAWPVITAMVAKGAAVGTGVQQAAVGGKSLAVILSAMLVPIKTILTKLGHGYLYKGIYSSISTAIKVKDASKISADIKAKEKEAKDKEIDGFKGAWNYCPLPQKESIEFDRMTQLAGL